MTSPPTTAIDLVIEPGTVHALLGENGAGKSTLMNVLFGLYDPDEGEILIDDKPVNFAGPGDAMAAGIAMVHQHFMLVHPFTVAENVMLGHEQISGPFRLLNLDAAREKVREISARFGFNVDPDAVVEDLAVGAQQRVEIIKALSQRAEVLILDEPTAVLTPQETDELLEIVRQLRESGTAIVLITHKLREVQAIADTITVIRRGKVVGTAHAHRVARGTGLAHGWPRGHHEGRQGASERRARSCSRSTTSPSSTTSASSSSSGVSFDVRAGEILAIAGVQGNGQTELTESLLGAVKPVAGKAVLDGKEITGLGIKAVLESGIGFVPEDRTEDGLVSTFTIANNLILDLYDTAAVLEGAAC